MSSCPQAPRRRRTSRPGLFNIAKSWSVTCSAPSTHQFRCDASLVVDEVHVEDRDHLLCPGASPCPDGWFTDCPGKPKDNCPDHYNPDQTDTDGNGKGDVCDGTPDHDVTVKSLLIFGPAPANLGDSTGRYMWAVGEIGNLRNHVETVELSLDIAGNPGCDEDIQTILPGHNPFTLMELERKRVGSPPTRRAPPGSSIQRLSRRAPQGGCKRRGRAREGGRNKKASPSVIDYEEW